mmetsp:Transcript_6073/g.11098  ORF Transcript_6073/g.11098 Transcript_6073/m.11098 type:complete len:162 (+) Transcript_6073:66-551(+)
MGLSLLSLPPSSLLKSLEYDFPLTGARLAATCPRAKVALEAGTRTLRDMLVFEPGESVVVWDELDEFGVGEVMSISRRKPLTCVVAFATALDSVWGPFDRSSWRVRSVPKLWLCKTSPLRRETEAEPRSVALLKQTAGTAHPADCRIDSHAFGYTHMDFAQ